MAYCGLLLDDGSSFLLLSDGTSVLLLNDNSCSAEPPHQGAGGGFATGWLNRWEDQKRREAIIAAAMQLATDRRVISSDKYQRVVRRLRIAREHLSMAVTYEQEDRARAMVEDLEAQLLAMEPF